MSIRRASTESRVGTGMGMRQPAPTVMESMKFWPGSVPHSLVAPQNVSVQVCATCHNSVRLSEKYGMPSQQFNSFQDSYHGLASRAGSVEVANCASCHGVHNIKPSSDPASTVNKANLAATCGRCHPGAGKNFGQGPSTS